MPDKLPARSLCALILDSDEEHARVLAATFELQGIKTTVLHSLESASECINRLQPQIMTYDLAMTCEGEQHVIESLRQMRAEDVEHRVLFSRSSRCKAVLDGLDDDMGRVFVKPVKLSQMLALVIEFKARFRSAEPLKVA